MQFETIIGLEVHAQLKTQSKIFCACSTHFGDAANQNTCPVCLGLPGALPVLNRKAVDFAITCGLALHCEIQNEVIWDRKNYFYPDLPKGYQITQLTQPLCLRGHLDIVVDGQPKRIGITRIHMEEDAGKSLHEQDDKASLIDLNRACTPLCEIVSEPDLRSPEEAGEYLRVLRQILRYCEICDGNMEEGSLRCDANVSLRPRGETKFGNRVEIKNLNSIRYLEKAIQFEIERQRALLLDGKTVEQETRLFDPTNGKTRTMRSKEDAHDYRYFPDPDLVPLLVDENWIEERRQAMPELPKAKTARFVSQYNLPEYDAGVLTADKNLAHYFEDAVRHHNNPKKISNWIMSELMRELKDEGQGIEASKIKSPQLARLVALIDAGTISGKMAKQVFEDMTKSGDDPEKIIDRLGLSQVSDTGAIEKIIDEVISANPKQYAEYKSGKEKLFGFFVGQTMKALSGQGNPTLINDLLKTKLNK